jgi:hypothetical protein
LASTYYIIRALIYACMYFFPETSFQDSDWSRCRNWMGWTSSWVLAVAVAWTGSVWKRRRVINFGLASAVSLILQARDRRRSGVWWRTDRPPGSPCPVGARLRREVTPTDDCPGGGGGPMYTDTYNISAYYMLTMKLY